jgi:response regulator RpfG family c-di-GMP phosphodiesterase
LSIRLPLPESLAPEPDFAFRAGSSLEVHFSVAHPAVVCAQPIGSFLHADGPSWSDQLALVVEACFAEGTPWALVIDLTGVSQSELETRLACFDRLKSLRALGACVYRGATGVMRFMIELGAAFQAPPFTVAFENEWEAALDLAGKLRLNPRALSATPPPALIDPRGPEGALTLLSAVAWAESGSDGLARVSESSPWRPVADAVALLKRDLDLLVGENRERIRILRADLAEAERKDGERQRALAESELLGRRLALESERRLSLTQEQVRQQKELLFALGEIIESRSRETANHIHRVSAYARHLAILSGLPEREATLVFHATPMHDAGKLAIPDRILSKAGPLDAEERAIMQGHARHGYDLLRGGSRDILGTASVIAHEHHEKWNGKGYPRGISGENIHPYGRITALADVFDALGSDRCYKKAWPLEKILALLREERGEHFEPRLIDLFLRHLGAFRQIRDAYPDEVA